MAHKKIIFVIVEGPSDDEALGLILSRIYEKAKVFVYIAHGDITTQAKPENILSRIADIIKGYAKSNHFTAKNFQKIILLNSSYAPSKKNN